MAIQSGFYNALETGGVYDRTYSADEYTRFYSAFLRDGVRRSGANDFYCSANGLVITVAAGYAICGSKWVYNDSIYTLPAITPPVGDYARIDAIFLHVDTNEATRAASIIYRQGTAASTPVAPAKDTTTGVVELCLCQIDVQPSATNVVVTDTRPNDSLCGWITSPVGYDDYFDAYDTALDDFMNQSQTAFNTWFSNVRQTLAVTTLFKQYTWYLKTTETTTTDVTFNIPQYDPTGVDILTVYVNGMREIITVDYTVSGSTITFTNAKVAGTEILVVVYKSIDGAGLGSVSDEVTALQNQVDDMQDVYEYNYICNGSTDNEGIKALLNSKLSSLDTYGSIKINVYGTFGATNVTGTSGGGTHGYLFMFTTTNTWGDKKIILDFSNCSTLDIDGTDFSANVYSFIWHTSPIEIYNLNAVLKNMPRFATIQTTRLYLKNCRIWFNYDTQGFGVSYATFASNGVFENCRISVTNGNRFGISADFRSTYLRVNGCECYAFKPTGGNGGTVIHATSNAPVFTSQLICPTVTRAGYTQAYAILDEYTSAAHASYSDTLTALTISASGQNVRGTISQSVQVMGVDTY